MESEIIVANDGKFVPGELVEVAVSIDLVSGDGKLQALVAEVRLPSGWSYESLGPSNCGPSLVQLWEGKVYFNWSVIPRPPFSFTFYARAIDSNTEGTFFGELNYNSGMRENGYIVSQNYVMDGVQVTPVPR